MMQRKNAIAYFSALAEMTYLFLLYALLALISPASDLQIVSLWGLVFIAISLITINLLMPSTIKLIYKLLLHAVLALGIVYCLLLIYNWGNLTTIIGLYLFKGDIFLSIQVWILALFIGLLTFRSMIIAGKDIEFREANNRCEISIGIFLLVTIIAGLLKISIPSMVVVIGLGLLCNFAAMALSHQSMKISPRYWMLAILSVGIFIWVLGSLIERGQGLLISLSQSIYELTMPYVSGAFLGLMKWLLVRGKYIENDAPPPATNSNQIIDSGWTMGQHNTPIWLEYVLWFIMGLIILLALIIVGFLLINIIKFLLGSQKKRAGEEDLEVELGFWYFMKRQVKEAILRIKVLYTLYLARQLGPEQIYAYLLDWGQQKNIPRSKNETPYEYCQRLLAKYPQNNNSINAITESYVAYKYGDIYPDADSLNILNRLLKKLYFPF